jgi:hypothetical protein
MQHRAFVRLDGPRRGNKIGGATRGARRSATGSPLAVSAGLAAQILHEVVDPTAPLHMVILAGMLGLMQLAG